MARLKDIVIDCERPASLARFWIAVLDGYTIAPYTEEDLASLRARGLSGPEEDTAVLLLPGPDGGPRVWCTQVPEKKTVKNRVHLDLEAPEPVLELVRLLAIGAQAAWETDGLWVLTDPEGNEFCLLKDPVIAP
ncbi:VOC family protein [Symbioplanes lichenis]|uniref:VOC family protein n=1 Tax=Symbioplanes lichenis TaxID=1629072 RepID=UPI0027392585|nr:VOC family protein [Actinoplanes lichenis]